MAEDTPTGIEIEKRFDELAGHLRKLERQIRLIAWRLEPFSATGKRMPDDFEITED